MELRGSWLFIEKTTDLEIIQIFNDNICVEWTLH